jgi:hypothetical protein
MAPGKVQGELGLGDWSREQDTESRIDTVNFGDALLRIGLTGSMEAQLGWTAFGHVRTRDRVTGAVEKESGIGDMRVALRQNLRNPDGSGFSIAVMRRTVSMRPSGRPRSRSSGSATNAARLFCVAQPKFQYEVFWAQTRQFDVPRSSGQWPHEWGTCAWSLAKDSRIGAAMVWSGAG